MDKSLDTLSAQEALSENDNLWTSPSSDILESELWQASDWNLAELLETQSSFSLRRLGPKGSYSLFSRSGIPGSSIRVLIDGIPQNPPGGGSANLEQLSLSDIESVEINRQSNSKTTSGSWPGGTIRLKSKEFSSGVSSQLLYGSFGQAQGNLDWKHDWGGLKSTIGGNYLAAENNFKIFTNNSTPYNSKDDAWITLKNAQQEQWKGFLNLALHNWKIHSHYNQTQFGLPGTDNNWNPSAQSNSKELELSLSHFHKALPFRLAYQQTDSEFTWGSKDKFWREVQEETSVGQQAQRVYFSSLLKFLSFLSTPLEASWERLTPHSNNDLLKVGLNWTAERYSFDPSVAINQSIGPLDFELKYHLNYRLENATNTKDTTTIINEKQSYHSAYGSKVFFQINSQNQLWAGAERTHLAPTLAQQFGGGQGMIGNHSLEDELGWIIETGYTTKTKPSSNIYLSHRVRPFWQKRENTIEYFIDSDLSKALNMGDMEIWALELNQSLKHTFWGVFSSLLLQSAKWVSGPSQQIDNTPANTPNWTWSTNVHLQPFARFNSVLSLIKLNANLKMFGESFKDDANLSSTPSYTLISSRLLYAKPNWSYSLGVNNLLDKTIQNGYNAFPTEGRSFYTQFSMNFKTQQTPKEKL